jgi:hypothetical protein
VATIIPPVVISTKEAGFRINDQSTEEQGGSHLERSWGKQKVNFTCGEIAPVY